MTGAFPAPLAELLHSARVYPPDYPPELLDRLVPAGRLSWVSDPDLPSPYDVRRYLELITVDRPRLAAMGHAGHGVNSWALHFHLVDGPLAALVQSAWGGVYQDPDDNRYQLTLRLARLRRLRAALASAREAGRVGAGERLLYADLGFAGTARIHWLGQPREPVGFDALIDHLARRAPGEAVSSA